MGLPVSTGRPMRGAMLWPSMRVTFAAKREAANESWVLIFMLAECLCWSGVVWWRQHPKR